MTKLVCPDEALAPRDEGSLPYVWSWAFVLELARVAAVLAAACELFPSRTCLRQSSSLGHWLKRHARYDPLL